MFRPKETWNTCEADLRTCSLTDKNVCKKLFIDKNGSLILERIPVLANKLDEEFQIGQMLGGGKSGAVLFIVVHKSRAGSKDPSDRKVLKIYLDALDEFGEILNERPYREVYSQCMVNGIGNFNCTQCFGLADYPTGPAFLKLKELEIPTVKAKQVLYQVTSMAGGEALMDLDLSKLDSPTLYGMCWEILSAWQVMYKRLGNFTHWDFHPDNIFIDVKTPARSEILVDVPKPLDYLWNLRNDKVPPSTLKKMGSTMFDLFRNFTPRAIEGFFTVFNSIRRVGEKINPFGKNTYTYDFGKTDVAKQVRLAKESGKQEAINERTVFEADKYFFTTKLKLKFPTVKLIDFDLVTSTTFPKLLPENEQKKNSFFGITERALQFCFKWLGGSATLRWLAILMTFRILHGILKDVPIISRFVMDINEDMYHIATYMYVTYVIRRKNEAMETISALKDILKKNKEINLGTREERMGDYQKRYDEFWVLDEEIQHSPLGGLAIYAKHEQLLMEYYARKIALCLEDNVLKIIFGNNNLLMDTDEIENLQNIILENENVDSYTSEEDMFDTLGKAILWKSIKTISEFGMGICLQECITDGVNEYLHAVADYSVRYLTKFVADKFLTGFWNSIPGVNSTVQYTLHGKIMAKINDIAAKFKRVKTTINMDFAKNELETASVNYEKSLYRYYQSKKFYPYPDVIGMGIYPAGVSKKLFLRVGVDKSIQAKHFDINFSGMSISMTSKQVSPKIIIKSTLSNYSMGFGFKKDTTYGIKNIIEDMNLSDNNYIELTDFFTKILMEKKLEISYPQENDVNRDLRGLYNSFISIESAIISGPTLEIVLNLKASADEKIKLDEFLKSYKLLSLKRINAFLNNISKTIPMFTLLYFSVVETKDDNNIFFKYNLMFKYTASPNPCVDALSGSMSLNFDLVNYLNCSSILSDFINHNIVDKLEAAVPKFLLFIKEEFNILKLPDEYYENNIPAKYFEVNRDSSKKTDTNPWTLLYYFFMLNSQYNLETFFHDGKGKYEEDHKSAIFSFDKATFITILINFLNGNNKQERTDDLAKLFNALEERKRKIIRFLVKPLKIGENTQQFFENYFKLDLSDPEGKLGKLIVPVGLFTESLRNAHREGYIQEKNEHEIRKDTVDLQEGETDVLASGMKYAINTAVGMFRS